MLMLSLLFDITANKLCCCCGIRTGMPIGHLHVAYAKRCAILAKHNVTLRSRECVVTSVALHWEDKVRRRQDTMTTNGVGRDRSPRRD